jgi:DNA polymerase-4
VGAVLQRFTPVVQAASIDEWYLDLSGTEALYAPETLTETAARIRETVRRETGIWLSLGGGTSKLVAKLAAERAKPRPETGGTGVHVVPAGDEGAFLHGLALADLPGVGPKLQAKLASLGLRRVEDVLPHERATLARWLGRRQGDWLWARVRGIHDAPVEGRAPAKQVSRETTFDRDIREGAALTRTLRGLCGTVAADLRRDGLAARTVTVKLKDADFTTRHASQTVAEAVESDRAIATIAVGLLAKLRAARPTPARLVGVALSGLAPARDADQLGLFALPATATERVEDRAVSRALDRVRERFGSDAIRFGV